MWRTDRAPLGLAGVVLIAALLCWASAEPSVGSEPEVSTRPRFVSLGVAGDTLVVIYHEAHDDPKGWELGERDWLQVRDTATGRLRWQRVVPAQSLINQGYGGRGAASGDLLCVPHADGDGWRGVDVFNVRDGSDKGTIDIPENSGWWVSVRCNRNRIMVAAEMWKPGPKPDATVVARGFDAATLRPVWQRTFPHAEIQEEYEWSYSAYHYAVQMEGGSPTAQTFELPLCDPAEEDAVLVTGKSRWYERVTLRARDGAVLSRPKVIWPHDASRMPTAPLPDAARKWLYRLFARNDTGRTHILEQGGLLFAGSLEDMRVDLSIPGRLFAVHPETAKVAWDRKLPGLCDIVLGKGALFAAYNTPSKREVNSPGFESLRERRPRLMALDAPTGRVLWDTAMGIPSPADAQRIARLEAILVRLPTPRGIKVYLCAAIILGFGCLVWRVGVRVARRRRQRQ